MRQFEIAGLVSQSRRKTQRATVNLMDSEASVQDADGVIPHSLTLVTTTSGTSLGLVDPLRRWSRHGDSGCTSRLQEYGFRPVGSGDSSRPNVRRLREDVSSFFRAVPRWDGRLVRCSHLYVRRLYWCVVSFLINGMYGDFDKAVRGKDTYRRAPHSVRVPLYVRRLYWCVVSFLINGMYGDFDKAVRGKDTYRRAPHSVRVPTNSSLGHVFQCAICALRRGVQVSGPLI